MEKQCIDRKMKVLITWFGGLLLVFAIVGISTTAANGQLVPDQENAVTDGTSFGCGTGDNGPIGLGSIFQTFTPSVSPLAAVDILLRAGGEFPEEGYDTTIKIRAGDFDGEVLGTATTRVPGPQSPGANVLVRFTISPSTTVTPGDTYVIEWISPLEGGVVLTWLGSKSDTYNDGMGLGCLGQPPVEEDWDFYFVTYTFLLEAAPDQPVPQRQRFRTAEVEFDLLFDANGNSFDVDCDLNDDGTPECTVDTFNLEELTIDGRILRWAPFDKPWGASQSPGCVYVRTRTGQVKRVCR